MTTRIGCLILGLFSLALSMAGQVGGTGTPKHIPIWTSSATLGDSIIFQTSGFPVGTTLQATGGDGLFGQFGHNGLAWWFDQAHWGPRWWRWNEC